MDESVSVAWTTVATEDQATTLAKGALETGFVACVQIDGPIRSLYPWKGRVESDTEYRLTFKLPTRHVAAAREWVLAAHPYETAQWIVVTATDVSAGYAQWVRNETKPH